jgi:hypothetical protein
MGEDIAPLPNTPSWRSAQLKLTITIIIIIIARKGRSRKSI